MGLASAAEGTQGGKYEGRLLRRGFGDSASARWSRLRRRGEVRIDLPLRRLNPILNFVRQNRGDGRRRNGTKIKGEIRLKLAFS